MGGFRVIFITFMACAKLSGADHEYMETKAESIVVPIDFETKLQCTMNIEPDKFQWKFYPLSAKDVYNPKALINLNSKFEFIPTHKPTKRESVLSIQADSKKIAGDYQCLAHYGASVVASVPWRITIQNLSHFPEQESIDVTVIAGNTINWRCEPPESNPEAYIDYLKNDEYIQSSTPIETKSLIIPNVSLEHTGKYRCRAGNTMGTINSGTYLQLKVVKTGPPQPPSFIMSPKSVYTVTKGGSVFFECAAIGNPLPEVVWKKVMGRIPEKRSELIKGGLIIKNVTSSDDGVYLCNQKNSRGELKYQITLIYNEAPSIECLFNSTDVKQGENLDLDCSVTGTPEPQITWFLNGFSVSNDSEIEAVGNRIYFRPVEKRHAGNLQIFARNVVETVYASISIRVIPLSTTQENSSDNPMPTRGGGNHRGNSARKSSKHTRMMPPSKPSVTRSNDETVVVRWMVPLNKGLPIQFFKVQYRELGPANYADHQNRGKWMTTNEDIKPHIRSYEIGNLKPDHWYRFRIAAVYSNNDNKNSPNSDKFHLRKLDFDNRNPLPIPLITGTETINSTAVQIYWKCERLPNIDFDGYFINYNSASSAADYMKATVDGEFSNTYILSHLQPDTVYDIKMQSFTSKSASDFSSIVKAKTAPLVTTPSPSRETSTQLANTENGGISRLYIVIAAGVLVGCGTIVSAIALLLFCRKWKQKKNMNRGDQDKPGVDEHHIQADGNEYVVGPKGASRTNGCIPPNRITITANPLADADNKNQNMIEMSCLSSQNNNCSATLQQPATTSGDDTMTTTTKDKKYKNHEKRIRNKHNHDSNTSGENYV